MLVWAAIATERAASFVAALVVEVDTNAAVVAAWAVAARKLAERVATLLL